MVHGPDDIRAHNRSKREAADPRRRHAATGIGTICIWPNYNNHIITTEFLLQGCVTWSVRLKVQCEMRVAERRGLSFPAFGGETEGGCWRRWHNEGFYAHHRM